MELVSSLNGEEVGTIWNEFYKQKVRIFTLYTCMYLRFFFWFRTELVPAFQSQSTTWFPPEQRHDCYVPHFRRKFQSFHRNALNLSCRCHVPRDLSYSSANLPIVSVESHLFWNTRLLLQIFRCFVLNMFRLQTHRENAPAVLMMTFYTELKDSKGSKSLNI